MVLLARCFVCFSLHDLSNCGESRGRSGSKTGDAKLQRHAGSGVRGWLGQQKAPAWVAGVDAKLQVLVANLHLAFFGHMLNCYANFVVVFDLRFGKTREIKRERAKRTDQTDAMDEDGFKSA